MFEKIYRSLVLVFLALILVSSTLSLILEYQQEKQCEQAVENYGDLIESTYEEYQFAVYENPATDNINKQIFLANEYQVILTNTIAAMMMDCH